MSTAILSGSQMSAFRSLQNLDQQIALSRIRLATPPKLSSPSDNFAIWRISSETRSRAAALAVLRGDLDRSQALTGMAAAALTRTQTSLQAIRSLLLRARDDSSTLDAVQRQLGLRVMELRGAAQSAALFGLNLLVGAAHRLSFPASSGLGAEPYAIEFDKRQTLLLGNGGTAGILERPFDLSALFGPWTNRTDGLSGPAVVTPGADAVLVSTGGLAGANTNAVVGLAAEAAKGASLRLGQINPAAFGSGDRLRLQVTVDGVTRSVTVALPAVADQALLRSSLQGELDTQFGTNKVRVSAAADGALVLNTVTVGQNAAIAVSSAILLDGDETTTSTGGLTAQADYSATTTRIGGSWRPYDALGGFDPLSLDRTDRLHLQIDAKVQTAEGSLTIDVALANVTDAASLAAAINASLAAQPVYGAYAGATVVGGEVAIYLKQSGEIRVSAIFGIDGDTFRADALLQTGSARGTAAVDSRNAAVSTGSDFAGPVTLADGMSLQFDLVRNGVVTPVLVTRADVDAALASDADYQPGSGIIADVGAFARVVSHALENAGINDVAVAAVGRRLRLTGTGIAATGDSLALDNVRSTGLPAISPTLVTGSDFSSPLILTGTQTLSFDLSVDGGTAIRVTLDRDTVERALGNDALHVAGRILDADALARVVQQALTDAGISGVDVGAIANRLEFTRQPAGAGSLQISNTAFDPGDTVPSNVTLLSLDMTSPAFAAADRSRLVQQLDSLLATIDTMIGDVSSAQDYTDFVSAQLTIHSTFTSDLEGIYRQTYGDLINVDMSDEEARLKALEYRRDLLQHSISLVNQSQKNVLILFEGMASVEGKASEGAGLAARTDYVAPAPWQSFDGSAKS